MPFFGTTPFAAPGLGIIAAAIMLAFGLWWLGRAEKAARRAGDGYHVSNEDIAVDDPNLRERATIASEFDPAELPHGRHSRTSPSFAIALLPLVVVIAVNLLMSVVVLPLLDTSFLAEEKWGATSLSAVGGVWAVVVALFVAIVTLIAFNKDRLPSLRESMDAGANASVLPAFSVARKSAVSAASPEPNVTLGGASSSPPRMRSSSATVGLSTREYVGPA